MKKTYRLLTCVLLGLLSIPMGCSSDGGDTSNECVSVDEACDTSECCAGSLCTIDTLGNTSCAQVCSDGADCASGCCHGIDGSDQLVCDIPEACDDGGAAGAPSTGMTPPEQCDRFADVWCDKGVGCSVEVGRLPAEQQDGAASNCKFGVVAGLDCNAVTSVGLTYADCLVGIDGMDCASWDVPVEDVALVTPPESCSGLFETQ